MAWKKRGQIHGINVATKNVKLLGIWIGKDLMELPKINLTERIQKLESILNNWRQRNLTIKGKIIILKCFAVPLITYPATFLPISKETIKQIDSILFNFIWPTSKHYVKKTTYS